MKGILCSVAAIFLLISLAASAQTTLPKRQGDKSEDAIIAAIVRYATLSRKGFVFLRVNGHDPSSATLRLLSEWCVRVLPASQAVFVAVPNESGAWKDVKTGELGSFFEAEDVKPIDDTRFAVSAGWGQPCGTYTVIFKNRIWSVENYKAWDICF